jgi:hypothetical protein
LDDSIKFSPEFSELVKGKSLEEIKTVFNNFLQDGTYKING